MVILFIEAVIKSRAQFRRDFLQGIFTSIKLEVIFYGAFKFYSGVKNLTEVLFLRFLNKMVVFLSPQKFTVFGNEKQ